MDLREILSPQDAAHGPAAYSTSSTPGQSPRKPPREKRSNSIKKSFTSSPRTSSNNTPSSLPSHVLTPRKVPLSPPAMSPTGGAIGGTPPPGEIQPSRQASISSMEALADAAAVQRPQPVGRLSSSDMPKFEEIAGSPSTFHPVVPTPPTTLTRTGSIGGRTCYPIPPKDFSTTSLPEAERPLATQLVSSLAENPYSYESQRQLCKLLHQGFIDHVYPPDSPGSHGDPHTYDILPDLRAARAIMMKQYALGHDLWTEAIQDESLLANTVEDRIAVMEMCQKAVNDEFGCTKLWRTYGDWMLYLYNAATQPDEANGGPTNQWSEEDKLVGKEVFTWSAVLDVWQRGAEFSKWRMHDSNLVWDRYIELLLQDLANPTPIHTPEFVRKEFEMRLKTPHATWDDTFQMYSTFISSQPKLKDAWEDIMVTTKRNTEDARKAWEVREQREIPLKQAGDSGDSALQYNLFLEYLDWSTQQSIKKRPFGRVLANALYERAVLYFPTDIYLWEEYSYYVIEESEKGEQVNMSLFSVLERATRHCPWSGSLWTQYLLSSENAEHTFEETEEIKHKATQTGLLSQAGLEEYLKVLTAWCSYLRRRAFSRVGQSDSDEDLDMAEVGIRSSIEELQKLGEAKYGEEYKGDPYFRLERIYIRFCCESGSWDNAREIYRNLVTTRGNSHEFWLRYYYFEMLAWARFIRHKDHEFGTPAATQLPPPEYATAVLKQALQRRNLDWPEKIAEFYIGHCEDHETATQLQLAVVEVNRANKLVAIRREKEAAAATLAAQKEQQNVRREALAKELENEPFVNGKRKRELEDGGEALAQKKTKSDEMLPRKEAMSDQPQSDVTDVAQKRDRENASIIVRNIPDSVSDVRVRQFFRGCGNILDVKIQLDGNSKVALVEFENKEDAEFATSRDGKDFEGQPVEVQIGRGTTLYVTNYPPTADEEYIRNLFGTYGEIMSVRFPSLKFDNQRRFCYVQFKAAAAASAATELDGTLLDRKYRLLAKHSDPTARQNRTGAIEEKREIFVRHLPKTISEDSLKRLFSDYGTVERVNIPLNVNGTSKGFAFIAFASKDSAHASLALDGTPQFGQNINVAISSAQPKRSTTTVISRQGRSSTSASPAPADHPNGTHERTSRRSSDAMAVTSASHDPQRPPVASYRDRSIALMGIPDTVNDARIRAFVEPYGDLVKIIVRHDHAGAIIEYADVTDAGKAALALDGAKIEPGRAVTVGTVAEMMQQRAERKTDRIQVGGGRKSTDAWPGQDKNSSAMQPSSFTRRPMLGRGGASAGRGRGRGRGRPGLGFTAAISKATVKAGQTKKGAEGAEGAEGLDGLPGDGDVRGKAKSK